MFYMSVWNETFLNIRAIFVIVVYTHSIQNLFTDGLIMYVTKNREINSIYNFIHQ